MFATSFLIRRMQAADLVLEQFWYVDNSMINIAPREYVLRKVLSLFAEFGEVAKFRCSTGAVPLRTGNCGGNEAPEATTASFLRVKGHPTCLIGDLAHGISARYLPVGGRTPAVPVELLRIA